MQCHLYYWSLTFSNLVAPKGAVFFNFLGALLVKSRVEFEGQQLIPSLLIPAITGKCRLRHLLHIASSSFTDPPCKSRSMMSYSLESMSFNSATATKSLRVLLGHPVSLNALAMLQRFSEMVRNTFSYRSWMAVKLWVLTRPEDCCCCCGCCCGSLLLRSVCSSAFSSAMVFLACASLVWRVWMASDLFRRGWPAPRNLCLTHPNLCLALLAPSVGFGMPNKHVHALLPSLRTTC